MVFRPSWEEVNMSILGWIERDIRPGRLLDFWSLRDHEVPVSGGAYVLVARPGIRFTYPNGSSPVFYIGHSRNLRRRLRSHSGFALRARDVPFDKRFPFLPRYEYAARFGGRYAYLQTWQGMMARSLEDYLLVYFVRKYRTFPVANGQGSWRRVEQVLRGWG